MNVVDFTKIEELEWIEREAIARCRDGEIVNLRLAIEFDVSLLTSRFVAIHEEKALQWQAEKRPRNLLFTHGEYFRGERGLRHVAQELRARRGSRRALLSLIAMDDILRAKDRPIPSFMILQFGRDGDTLYATAYFRALEVSRFLAVNVTEVCLIAGRMCRELRGVVDVRAVRLLLVAFKAYRDENFTLERAEIDCQRRGAVALAVRDGEFSRVARWCEDKAKNRSFIERHGVLEIATALDTGQGSYPVRLRDAIRGAVESMSAVKVLRGRMSSGEELDRAYGAFAAAMGTAAVEFRALESRDGVE